MERKDKIDLIKIYLAVGLACFGCLLLMLGMLFPPLGIIDTSIIITSGEVFTFSGTLIGIHSSYAAKHKELEHKINNKLFEGDKEKSDIK